MESYSDYLQHHGILGMKWGVRRYQNEDGTLTEAGKKRYRSAEEKYEERSKIRQYKHDEKMMRLRQKQEELDIRNQIRSAKQASRPTYSATPKPVRTNADVDQKLASDKELADASTRLQKEKNYQDLQKGTIANGSSFAKALLISAATVAVTTFVTQAAQKWAEKGANAIVNKRDNDAKAAKEAREERIKDAQRRWKNDVNEKARKYLATLDSDKDIRAYANSKKAMREALEENWKLQSYGYNIKI